ncbi:hypothetical protein R3P38DRAFT_2947494, partial [Favolaschia claudopus]
MKLRFLRFIVRLSLFNWPLCWSQASSSDALAIVHPSRCVRRTLASSSSSGASFVQAVVLVAGLHYIRRTVRPSRCHYCRLAFHQAHRRLEPFVAGSKPSYSVVPPRQQTLRRSFKEGASHQYIYRRSLSASKSLCIFNANFNTVKSNIGEFL